MHKGDYDDDDDNDDDDDDDDDNDNDDDDDDSDDDDDDDDNDDDDDDDNDNDDDNNNNNNNSILKTSNFWRFNLSAFHYIQKIYSFHRIFIVSENKSLHFHHLPSHPILDRMSLIYHHVLLNSVTSYLMLTLCRFIPLRNDLSHPIQGHTASH